MIMPASAMMPSRATKPKGARNSSRANAAPITPKGAVTNTRKVRDRFCNCTISRTSVAITTSGIHIRIDFWAIQASSLAAPVSMK